MAASGDRVGAVVGELAVEFLHLGKHRLAAKMRGDVADRGHEHDLIGTVQQTLVQHLGCRDVDLEVHARRQAVEGGKRALEIERPIGDHGVDRTEAEAACQFALRLADAAAEFLQRAEQFERRLMDVPPLVRQQEAAAPATAQAQAQPVFQMAHMGRNRRLRHAEGRLRGGKPAMLHDRGEDPQEPQFRVAKREVQDAIANLVDHASIKSQLNIQS